MYRSFCVTMIVLCTVTFGAANGFAGENPCNKLEEPVSGPGKKYSISADANGFAAFDNIFCGIKWRKGDLCAMEMVSFDASAQVVDFYSGKEIAATSACYVVEAPQEKRVIAFESEENAARFISEKGGGKKLDYDALNEYVE